MTENIKTMFSKMNDTSRDIAIENIKKEFDLDDSTKIYKDWFIRGNIPEQYQEITVSMFQNLLRLQALKTREIMVNL
ncbi:MAG: hypothetical protein ACJAU2_001969 [Maribacter sp.]|jgi:hypothetical protein